MSVVIEATQYITGLGIAEFDDVFGNTLGGWIGVLTAWVWLSWRKSSMDEQKTEEKKSEEKKRWQKPCMEFDYAGVSEYWRNRGGRGQTQGSGGYPGSVLHLWDVLPLWPD